MAPDPVMTAPPSILAARHIQNLSEASSLEPHWGYASRAVPCTNDAGSCEYLDVVYHSHDLGMLYSGIFWATMGGILLVWALGRRLFASVRQDQVLVLSGNQQEGSTPSPRGTVERLKRATAATGRRYLLPDAIRLVFGRVSRLQVLILVMIVIYLTVWSFVGIVYKTWITPVKKMDGVYNTRTSLGPWSDRIGILAYALTPFSVLLGSRESLLSLLTGVPYQHFNFLHRWLGYVIFVQSVLHTIGWCVIEARLYQPQPTVGKEWIAQLYMQWGVVAMILLTFLFVLSQPAVIKLTGYEFFRKTHYVLAMVYIGACWGHWDKLKCFLLPGLLLWFLDRGARLVRTGLLHYNVLPTGGMGFHSAKAEMSVFSDSDGDVVRMDFSHPQDAWSVGQHFFLTFPESTLWQAHPFTPLSLPVSKKGLVQHAYIFRAKGGETKKIAALAASKLSTLSGTADLKPTTPVVLTGPYGADITSHLLPDVNVLAVAGGTGISFVLPPLLHLISKPVSPGRRSQLIWVVRRQSDIEWVRPELDALVAASHHEVSVRVFVTRSGSDARTANSIDEKAAPSTVDSASSSSTASGISILRFGSEGGRHPDLSAIVNEFVSETVRGSTTVYASGPGGMMSDLRATVAKSNEGAKVWKGDGKYDVCLVTDDRLEW